MGLSELGAVQKITTPERTAVTGAQVQKTPDKSQKANVPKEETAKSLRDLHADSKEKLDRVAQAMENYIQSIQRDLRIRIDDKTDQVVIQVISKSEGKIIRQIPPEELLKLAAKMEEMTGLLFNKSA